MTLKKYANQLAVSIVNKRGGGDSNLNDDLANYFWDNTKLYKQVDTSIGGDTFEKWVRDKIELLYKIEYDVLPCFRNLKKEIK
jgi:hypothetical protein